jgi:hypothetical protein
VQDYAGVQLNRRFPGEDGHHDHDYDDAPSVGWLAEGIKQDDCDLLKIRNKDHSAKRSAHKKKMRRRRIYFRALS